MAENELVDTARLNGVENVDIAVENFVNEFLKDRLRRKGYVWTPSHQRATARTIEADVGNALRSLADEFTSQFQEQILSMCAQLTLTAESVHDTIDGVANELFSEGIKWTRIVGFFVFGSELAIYCQDNNAHELINILAHSISVYVTVTLLPWINHHGGWTGLIQFNEEGKKDGEKQNNRWPGVRNLLCVGLTAVGAITLGAVLTRS